MDSQNVPEELHEEYLRLDAFVAQLNCRFYLEKLWKARGRRVPTRELGKHLNKSEGTVYRQIGVLRERIREYNEKYKSHLKVKFDIITKPKSGFQLVDKPAIQEGGPVAQKPKINVPRFAPFCWQVAGHEPQIIPLHCWLPTNSPKFSDIEFTVFPPWSPPPGFSGNGKKGCGYEAHRQRCLLKMKQRDKELTDHTIWRVIDARVIGYDILRVEVQQCKNSDFYATCLSLDTKIPLDNGEKTDIRGWLAPSWKTGTLRDFFPAAGCLAVNLLIKTKTNSAILIRQSEHHTISAMQWVASVSRAVNFHGDSASMEHRSPDPNRTASFAALEEAGLEISVKDIHWRAFSIGLRFGSPALLGEVTVSKSEGEALKDFAKRGREGHRQSKTMDFVQLKDNEILRVLDNQKEFEHRSYFELGLALALIAQGKKANIVEKAPEGAPCRSYPESSWMKLKSKKGKPKNPSKSSKRKPKA